MRRAVVRGLCLVLVALVTTALFVTACSRSKRGRSTNLGARVIPLGQPVPKGGGRYKVGSPYQINGRWYRPKENSRYDQVGVASWYGELFHGRYTANGEIYDMAALSAAHPTLPMPVLVRVTNLENGRSLVVRVNDRGPYAHDRIIDMSDRSARLLGFKRQGTARVRVTYLRQAPLDGNDAYERRVLASQSWAQYASVKGVKSRPSAADPMTVASITHRSTPDLPERKPDGERLYFVQAASFRRRERAEHMRQDLRRVGDASIFPAEVEGTIWYRVRLGPFNRRSAAEDVRDRLQRSGNDGVRIVEN